MLISSETEQISLPLADATEVLRSSPMGSNPDSSSPSTIYTDVNVVPEHEKTELEQSITNLEGEIAQLRQKERLLIKKRKEALNKILDIKGNIRVFCRVRPFLSTYRRRLHEPISVLSEKIVVRSIGSRRDFGFDKVFDQGALQEDVFVEVEPILRSAFDGHNVCILAYGQTGTGKTFTMDGTNDQPGIIPHTLELLFHLASLDITSPVTYSISMLEVYMGNLRDLLAPKVAFTAYKTLTKCNLNIQTDSKGSVEIEGLTEVRIPDFAQAKWWYAKGRRARSTSWTNVNETSSRSHCLTRITISPRDDGSKAKKEASKLWMVDLGGSERLLKTGAIGQTLDEGRAINLSLSSLGDVIAALRRKRGHVPYRNSKLTQILKDSLGHGSKVLMIVHVSPCGEDVAETICSLSFANRARAVETNQELPEDIKKQRQKRIMELEEDMREAEEEIKKVRNQTRNAETLLNENKRVFSINHQLHEGMARTPRSTKEDDAKEAIVIHEVFDKGTERNMVVAKSFSLPRFMASTVASRQRQSAAESLVAGRARSLRPVTRSSVQVLCSQSLGHSDIHPKAVLRDSNKKSQYGELRHLPTESPRCNVSDLKVATALQQTKMVTSSDPNFRTTLRGHRRRMSNLI